MGSEEKRDMIKTGKEIARLKRLSVPSGSLFIFFLVFFFSALQCLYLSIPPSLLAFSVTVILVLAVAEICSLPLLLLSLSDSKNKSWSYPLFADSLLPCLPSFFPLSIFSSFLPLFLPTSFPSLLPFIS